MNAIKLTVEVKEDHVIKLPPEVPVGPAEVIVIAQASAKSGQRPIGLDAGKGFSVPDDFDDPLPPDVQRLFNGEGA
ncbi:hypothetical protein L6Q96_09705 [Candidatus Binatia bacterium]|nr:hypothetical protein [Candidatus Binatia bacterium]